MRSEVTSSYVESQVYICNIYNEHRMVVSRSCGQRRKCFKSLCIHSFKMRMGCVGMGDVIACCYTVLENIEVDEGHFFIVVDLSLLPS